MRIKRKLFAVVSMMPIMALSQHQDTINVSHLDSLSNKVFLLGEVNVIAPSKKEISGKITQEDMESQNRHDVSHALNMLPGVTLTSSGPRNESMVSIRGFDLRAIPVYMDGIPIYVPYDGYVDLARFTTFDLSSINVSKGFSSMLYGPNSLGGAINLISRKPSEKLEYDGALGIINTNGFNGNVNIGSNLGKFYIQGGYSYLHRDSYNLSKKYIPSLHENGGERENSYRTDQKINVKVGWTPKKNNEYVLGYINQKGNKGTPVYAGNDSLNSQKFKPRYWKWPSWDKETYYFISNTKMGKNVYLKSRLYYDIFKNTINSYDDSTYTTQKKPYAFQSSYNDYTYGGSIEYGTTIIPKNELKLIVHFKEDIHRENNLDVPVINFEDNTVSIALEDIYTISNKIVLIPGVSYNGKTNRRAEDYNSKTKTISNFESSGTSNAINGQLGLFYYFSKNQKASLTASRKTRFSTIKDRYSYRMGTALPNPNLKPEASYNIDLSYSALYFEKLYAQTSIFYSNITDAILSVNNVESGKSQMQNTGNAEFMGVEVALKYEIQNNLLGGINYSYIERHNLIDPTILFTDVPNSKVFSYIKYNPNKQIQAIASLENNSSRYSTSYGTKVAGFSLLNASISGRVWKYVNVEAGINNIFDKNYSLVEGYPEEGRNFFVTVRFFNHK